jgi:hypothetical protein
MARGGRVRWRKGRGERGGERRKEPFFSLSEKV